MNRIVVSFAAALMLGGSSVALAQQGKEGGGRPEAPGQNQAAPGGQGGAGAERGGPSGQRGGPGAGSAEGRGGQPAQAKGRGDGADRAAQGKQDGDRGRQANGKQDGDRDRQAQEKQKDDRERQAQDKQKGDHERQAQEKQKGDRERQAQDKQKGDRERQAQEKQKGDRDRQAQEKQKGDRGDRDRQAREGDAREPGRQAGARPGDDGRAGRIDLSDNQRERMRREFRQQRERDKVRHYRNVNVNIDIGRRAPRNWRYHPVPSFIIDVAPRYRGYRYVWVEDRYYIVNPTSYEVVAYVDDDSGYVYASGGRVGTSATGRGGGEVGRAGRCEVSLNDAERRRIIAAIDDWNPRPLPVPNVRIGIDLPGNVELRLFPDRLRSDFRELEGCRFIPVANDRLLIVEADTRRVVAIVDRR